MFLIVFPRLFGQIAGYYLKLYNYHLLPHCFPLLTCHPIIWCCIVWATDTLYLLLLCMCPAAAHSVTVQVWVFLCCIWGEQYWPQHPGWSATSSEWWRGSVGKEGEGNGCLHTNASWLGCLHQLTAGMELHLFSVMSTPELCSSM
jgi:hypothetical protein